MAQFRAMQQSLEAYKNATKEKSPWDYALKKFEKTEGRLDPLKQTEMALEIALGHRFTRTCQWVFKDDNFVD